MTDLGYLLKLCPFPAINCGEIFLVGKVSCCNIKGRRKEKIPIDPNDKNSISETRSCERFGFSCVGDQNNRNCGIKRCLLLFFSHTLQSDQIC